MTHSKIAAMTTAITNAISVLKSSNIVPAWGKTGCPGKLTDPPGIFSTDLSWDWGALQRNASAIMAAIRPRVPNQHTIEISRSALILIRGPSTEFLHYPEVCPSLASCFYRD